MIPGLHDQRGSVVERNKKYPDDDGKQFGPIADQQAEHAEEVQNEQCQLYIIVIVGGKQGEIGRMPMKPKQRLNWQNALTRIKGFQIRKPKNQIGH